MNVSSKAQAPSSLLPQAEVESPVSRAPDAGVAKLFAYGASMPNSTAVRDERATLQWSALADEIVKLAGRLSNDGVVPEAPVLLLVDSCVEAVIAYWAVRSLGGVAVMADPGCKRDEFDQFVAATQPGWVFSTRPGTWERLGMNEAPAATIAMTWYLQDQGSPGDGTPRPWLRRETEGAEREERLDGIVDPAVILFSSGTTGEPKTIVHTAASVNAIAEVQRTAWQLTGEDVVLGALPFHTVYGSIYSAASAIANGASLALLGRFHPRAALSSIERWGVTTAAMVPAMLIMMLKQDDGSSFDLSSLRAIYTGSAPISDDVIDEFAQFSGASVLASYGLTECPAAAVEPSDRPHAPGAAGRLSPGFEAVTRDASGQPLPAGSTGEITLRGPSTMACYLGRPDLTQERLRDGWVYTQDLGVVDEEGNIFVKGRAGDMIIRGGLNIAPREIEAVLMRHPDVLQAAVVGTPDEVYGQVVKAYVVPRLSADMARLDVALQEHCAASVSRAKVPAEVVLLRQLPMNAGGKVVRSALAESEAVDRIAPVERPSSDNGQVPERVTEEEPKN